MGNTISGNVEFQIIEAINSCEGRISAGADIGKAFDWLREELEQIKNGGVIYGS
jgi:hypothetical protein